jgi:hypothetical protein
MGIRPFGVPDLTPHRLTNAEADKGAMAMCALRAHSYDHFAA